MSQWHNEHPDLVGTDADPWMIHEGYRAAVREARMDAWRSRDGRRLDDLIAEAEADPEGREP